MRRAAMAAAVVALAAGCLLPGGAALESHDTEAPVLDATSPADGEAVDRNGALLVTFSEPMDPSSLGDGGIQVLTAAGEAQAVVLTHPAAVAPDLFLHPDAGNPPFPVTIRPAGGTWQGNAGTLVVAPPAADLSGVLVVDETRVSFSVRP